jgi:hypothetical protein
VLNHLEQSLKLGLINLLKIPKLDNLLKDNLMDKVFLYETFKTMKCKLDGGSMAELVNMVFFGPRRWQFESWSKHKIKN